jgi:hypothetical protein
MLQPNYTTFESMSTCISDHDALFPPVKAEQALLNLYFGAETVPLPYVYNNTDLVIRERTSLALHYQSRHHGILMSLKSPLHQLQTQFAILKVFVVKNLYIGQLHSVVILSNHHYRRQLGQSLHQTS